MRPSRQLRIQLFGHLQVTFESQPIVSLQTARYQSLMAYFILRARSPQPRSQIAALFWPNTSDTNAKTNLRRALYRIKKLLPESDQFLQTTAKTIAWQPQLPFWLDVTEFETILEQAAQQKESPAAQVKTLEQAVALYQGGLLLTCYDDWIEPTRHRLIKRMVSALAELGHLLGELQAYPSAITYTQALLQLEPLNESGYLKLMQLHVKQGERASALQVYQQYMGLLHREIGIAPSAEIRRYYESLLIETGFSPSAPMPSHARPNNLSITEDSRKMASESVQNLSRKMSQIDWGEAPNVQFFRGRTEETTQLCQWIEKDDCRLVAVVGMAGMGKTALVAQVADDLQEKFDFIVWRSLRTAPTLERLLEDLISFLSKQQEDSCSITRLLFWLRQSRALVILDNIETLFKGGESAGTYREGYENYCELFSVIGQANHQSCVVLTSREKSPEISALTANLSIRTLHLGGSPEAALAIIDSKQLAGTQLEKEQLFDHYGHNLLLLQMISGSIRDTFSGEIALFLAGETLLLEGVYHLLAHQFERMTALEKTVMVWLSINQEWSTLVALKGDINLAFSKAQIIGALESLCWRSLIDQQGHTYKPQPAMLAYVRSYLLEQISHAMENSADFTKKSCAVLAIAAYPIVSQVNPTKIAR